ncbi:MAG: KTSC domain-containing protein [Candidatus Fonsibacter ubiquis]
MAILTEKIEGKEIMVEINSSNLKRAIYNTESNLLTVTFNNGAIYEYYEFPWEKFTKFRMSDSQGKFLNSNINGKYKYKKVV